MRLSEPHMHPMQATTRNRYEARENRATVEYVGSLKETLQ
jgi:hypothetical protein